MTRLPAGPLPSMDFETYSSAGYEWNGVKWERLAGADKYGLEAVGVAVYAEHPSTEVLSLAYDLLDGRGVRVWIPGLPLPQDLFDHLGAGKLMSAWNDGFEYHIWRDVCVPKLGWPPIDPRQLRDDAAKARAWGLPGALAKAAAVMGGEQKDSYDKLLWCPKGGSKQPRPMPHDHPDNYSRMLAYCAQDVVTEMDLSARIPDLEGDELEFALLTAQMNYRGMAVDMESVDACIATLERAYADADGKLAKLTDGAVTSATQGKRLIDWLATQGVTTTSLDADHREALLARPWPPGSKAHEALKLFDLVTSAGVKKVYAMKRMANRAGRLCNMYIYHGARTGRDSGAAVQPQNLVKAGHPLPDGSPWSWEHAEETLRVIREGRAAEVFDSPVLAVSGCIRSLFVAAPGHDLICSDYSSIEAVVTAALAGEQWRLDAFARGDDIYLLSCGSVTGKSYEWYMANGGKKHPDRQKFGKPLELSQGFGGYVGALMNFGYQGTEEDGKRLSLAWRAASPMIVEFWGGQVRGKPWRPDCFERFGLEGMAINAVQFPGHIFTYRQISYQVRDNVLYCKLPSGRELAYHRPKLAPSTRWENTLALSFEGWNSNPKKKGGAVGWQRMELYGGLLCENCIAEGTEVLTDRGWVKIENVQDTDRVHDGVGFVNHGGLLFKSVQKCVSIDGVYMTPDHEVLTDEGWKAASQNPKPLRPEIRGAYRGAGREKRWQKTLVDLAVRLRRHLRKGGDRSAQGAPARADTQLRLSNPWHSAGQSNFARHVAKPGVCGMAQHEGALFKPHSRSMEELRRSRHSRMRRMVEVFRGFLAGYGADVPTGFRTGPPGQRRRVRCRQLPMGNARHEFEQPAHVENDKDAGRYNERCRSLAALRHRQIHDSLPNKNGLARGPDFKVYDIVNAGPRHRFVVRGENGPFIVHNCVQATARDILRGGVIALERAGYPIVLRVHDEIAAEVPEGWGSIEEFERLMATIPPWAEGWPIKAAGGWRGKRYRKD